MASYGCLINYFTQKNFYFLTNGDSPFDIIKSKMAVHRKFKSEMDDNHINNYYYFCYTLNVFTLIQPSVGVK